LFAITVIATQYLLERFQLYTGYREHAIIRSRPSLPRR